MPTEMFNYSSEFFKSFNVYVVSLSRSIGHISATGLLKEVWPTCTSAVRTYPSAPGKVLTFFPSGHDNSLCFYCTNFFIETLLLSLFDVMDLSIF